ncbi:MAG TPA: hypothetical protein VFV19_16240 [Candidatus Polarisedimenticolaceae bacterium]|nr:hypothetical protein [Candidatus Polarisedimenticolaceae bacterium]
MSYAIDHLAEEIERMEHVNPWARVIRWSLGIGLVAVCGWLMWTFSGTTSTASRAFYIPAGAPAIETSEPLGGTLAEAPVRFTWDAVNGRMQYIVRVYEKGATTTLFERASTTTSFELTPEERAKMPKGKSYVWTVVAQAKSGSTLAAGQSAFKVR